MFGRRKKNDGFEWHKYVRTTIKLRREDRRKRVEDILLAAENAKNAGQAKAHASLFQLTKFASFFSKAAFFVWTLVKRISRGFISTIDILWKQLYSAVQSCLPSILLRPGLASLLGLMGLVAAGSAVARTVTIGWDLQAVIAACCACLFLFLTVVHALFHLPRLIKWRANKKIPSFAQFSRINQTMIIGLASVIVISVIFNVIWYFAPKASLFAVTENFSNILLNKNKPVKGLAKAITGDTLIINNTVIRLDGIEAPKLVQRCLNRYRRRWWCGRVARKSLARLTGRQIVKCEIVDSYGGLIKRGQCSIDGRDIAAKLIKEGRVFAIGGPYGKYGTVEEIAQRAKSGVWSGTAQRPEAYRKDTWKSAQKRAPNGCPIKGHVSKKRGKTYLLPWSPGYRRERISKQRGERWFCNEKEAIAAGWEPDPAS